MSHGQEEDVRARSARNVHELLLDNARLQAALRARGLDVVALQLPMGDSPEWLNQHLRSLAWWIQGLALRPPRASPSAVHEGS